MLDRPFFCSIENETKSHDIVKLYWNTTKSLSEEKDQFLALMVLDNQIQIQEIETHLFLNHIPEYYQNEERLNWIRTYGESFRTYLNTLKVLFLVLISQNIDIESLTFEDFCYKKDHLNRNKAFLDIIHA